MNIEKFDSSDQMYSRIGKLIHQIVQQHDSYNIAISGGSTPIPLYNYLGKNPLRLSDKHCSIFWVDERFVPKTSVESNFKSANECWLQFQEGINVFPIQTEDCSPEESVTHYKHAIKRANILNLVLLGMGEDGHIASIFPSTTNFNEDVIVTNHPLNKSIRISLGLPTILKSDAIWLIIKGKNKYSVLMDSSKMLPIHRLLKSKEIRVFYCE